MSLTANPVSKLILLLLDFLLLLIEVLHHILVGLHLVLVDLHLILLLFDPQLQILQMAGELVHLLLSVQLTFVLQLFQQQLSLSFQLLTVNMLPLLSQLCMHFCLLLLVTVVHAFLLL